MFVCFLACLFVNLPLHRSIENFVLFLFFPMHAPDGSPHLLSIVNWAVFLLQGPTSAHVQLIMERLLRRINRTVIGMSRQSPHIVSLSWSPTLQGHGLTPFHQWFHTEPM